MDEDEIYRQLEALKDRQDAKLPGIGAESDPLYHELDFRVQYELAIRSTRGPHVNDVHEHVRAPELVRALRELEPARAERLLQARRMNLPAKIALGDAPLSDDGTLNIRNVHVVDEDRPGEAGWILRIEGADRIEPRGPVLHAVLIARGRAIVCDALRSEGRHDDALAGELAGRGAAEAVEGEELSDAVLSVPGMAEDEDAGQNRDRYFHWSMLLYSTRVPRAR